MLELFEFISLSFPKAGTAEYFLPLTIANITFVLAILRLGNKNLSGFNVISKNFTITYVAYAVLLLISLIINIESVSGNAYLMAFTFVMIASPLAISIGYSIPSDKAMKIVAWSVIITSVYGLLQFFVGVEETTVPGVSLAIGEQTTAKNIYRWINGIRVLVKTPSTYQNGSLFAPFLLMAIFLLLNWKKSKLRDISLALGIIGFIIAGSRCSVVAVIVLFITIIIMRVINKDTTIRKRNIFVVLLFAVICLLLLFSGVLNAYLDRLYFTYIGFTSTDLTASGRTVIWGNLFDLISNLNVFEFIRFIIIGINWKDIIWTEGLTYFFTQFGVIAFVLYLYMLYMITHFFYVNKRKYIVYGILGSFYIFCIDGTFIYTPTMINFFLMIGIALKAVQSQDEA